MSGLIATGRGSFWCGGRAWKVQRDRKAQPGRLFGNEHPKSVFERHHRAVATASAFRKDDEDRSFFLWCTAQLGKGVGPAIFPPHQQGVEHDCENVLVTVV